MQYGTSLHCDAKQSNCQVHVHRASHRAQHCNAFRSVASQDIKTALGLPSGIKLGQYNALAAFTANPTGPGRKVNHHTMSPQSTANAWHATTCERVRKAVVVKLATVTHVLTLCGSCFRSFGWQCSAADRDGACTQVYTTEVALLNLANLAASLLYKEGSTNVDYNILGIQTLVVRSRDVYGACAR